MYLPGEHYLGLQWRHNRGMEIFEMVVWAVMLGGLLTLGTMAVVDVFVSHSLSAWRGLIFMAVTGTSCVFLSGLPEDLYPDLPVVPVLALKGTLGPMSGAMVLIYLKQWLGVAAEDRFVHHTINWGTFAMLFGTVFVAALCILFAEHWETEILLIAALFNAIAVLMATATAVRAVQLGDRLARTMAMGCLALAVSSSGLFAHQLLPDNDLEWWPLWILTSFSTVVFYMVMVSLSIRYNRQVRHLERMASLSQGMDPATGLPRGSVLLSKVDDAIWRSQRLDTSCVVICLHLRNLYELGDEAGHSVDQQILSAMAARIRRAMGFRCLIGLYHPRCFVVVLSAVKQPKVIPSLIERLRELMSRPLDVIGANDNVYPFNPQFLSGHVTVSSENQNSAQILDEAEHIALNSERGLTGMEDTVRSPLSA